MATYNGAYEDGELEISLAPSANRRANNKPPDASSRDDQGQATANAAPQQTGPGQPPHKNKADLNIGAYQIIKTLGEGSFGKVKLATHRITGQQVALKIIARKKLISRDMAGRVEREIEYLQLLRHPHIIKLYTVIKTTSEIIMVLEYAGGELFDYIVNNGKMREDEARRFFQQIICAVEYCHRHKIVHRDLKPENLLLDSDLNVKIADFGLSNIMTDGNFLKTSCGSPNYAAPEVINGKLYAGPEVDVWSCGVILYVLLVGRLPFDDEHIPSLFAKIAKGHYTVPSYVGADVTVLMKKMLAVNPTNRITIDEIRLDPWFTKDLAPYLQPPAEEFIDTGVEPADKSSSVRSIDPRVAPALAHKLHNEVTEKISQTMGYGIQDVRDALAAPEQSAIRDAYMIVRENKLMAANPNLADDKGQLLFQAPSPPPWNDGIKLPITNQNGSPVPRSANDSPLPAPSPAPAIPSSLLDAMSPRSTSTVGTDRSARPYVSKIGILPSSLPAYHKLFWEAHKSGKKLGEGLSTTHAEDTEPHPQTDAEKAETRSRLNPHSKGSHIKLADAAKPAGMTAIPQKKSRPIKWQFGIRSRNQPLEAIGCIYRALHKLGAEWRIDDDDVDEMIEDLSLGSDDGDASGSSLHHANSMGSGSRAEKPQFRTLDSKNKGGYKLPKDPWVIHVRWKVDNLLRPGQVPPGSTHSSAIDLRRPSITSIHSVAGSAHTPEPSSSPKHTKLDQSHVVYMHMDIQLYEMEHGVYLVDFKCSGYENANGQLHEDKDVTSPFPFLDQASKLIIALAESD